MRRALILAMMLGMAISVGSVSAASLCGVGGATARGGLEPAFLAASTGAMSKAAHDLPARIPVCGDGVCTAGEPPFGENCSTCPEDCGGPCGGTDCPKVISSRTVTVLIGMQWQGNLACFAGTFYQPALMTYRRYIEDTIRLCDGSIITQVRSGSTSTFTTYCYRRTSFFCSGGNPFPPPCQL